jgi:hypothetical protein
MRAKIKFKSRADFENATPAVIKSPVIEMAPKASNATQADRLESFLKWGIKNYPSKNLLVIVWGHGQGWTVYKPKNPLKSGRTLKPSDVSLGLPLETKSTPHGKWGGLAFSDSDGSYLDIPSLNRILGRVSQTRGRPVDLYASDACLMQMLEVSTELSQNARFVVGSTQIQSFNGLPYRSLMWNLNRGSVSRAADPAYAVAQLLPKIMKASMDPRSGSQGRADPSGYKTLLMGSLNTQESNQVLLPALGTLGKSLTAYLQEDSFRKSDVQYLIQNTPAFEGNAQDLGIFLGLLDMLVYKETQTTGKPMTPAAASLKRSIDQAKDALNRAVVNYAYGKNYTSAESGLGVSFMPRSLSVWLPSTAEDYKLRRTDFARSRFYKTVPAWSEWLGKLYSQQ